ncbi:hypothetical protein SK128_003898, partial [Halocaridina rubra]
MVQETANIFETGDAVYVSAIEGVAYNWVPAMVIQTDGNIMEVQLCDGRTFQRHIVHIRKRVTDSNDHVALPSKSTDLVVIQPREIASESLVADETEGSVPATEISPISKESVPSISKPQSLASAPVEHQSDLSTCPAIAFSLPRRSQHQ